MKHVLLICAALFAMLWLPAANALQGDLKSDEAVLENVGAFQGLAIANQWKWSRIGLKTYVTPAELIFKFPNGKMKRIPLPEDKMVVAVAPYIKKTHQ